MEHNGKSKTKKIFEDDSEEDDLDDDDLDAETSSWVAATHVTITRRAFGGPRHQRDFVVSKVSARHTRLSDTRYFRLELLYVL